MSSYPIYIQPRRFTVISESLPPLPQAPPKPKLIKKNWFEKLILWEDEWEDREINARRLMKYEQRLLQYKEEVKKILDSTVVDLFREKKKQEFISQTEPADISFRDVKQGRYEESFYYALKAHFGGKIHTNLELRLPSGSGYIPDIAYIDGTTGLCIDIEIDEPYSLPEKQPIHCIGDDNYRNEYFNSKGWFVIRFAEEQVAQQPEACCNYIRAIIEHIYDGKPINSSVNIVNQWTYWDAKEMADKNYRDSY